MMTTFKCIPFIVFCILFISCGSEDPTEPSFGDNADVHVLNCSEFFNDSFTSFCMSGNENFPGELNIEDAQFCSLNIFEDTVTELFAGNLTINDFPSIGNAKHGYLTYEDIVESLGVTATPVSNLGDAAVTWIGNNNNQELRIRKDDLVFSYLIFETSCLYEFDNLVDFSKTVMSKF